MRKKIIIKLEGATPDGVIRVMADRINLAEGKRKSVETLTRTFKYPSDHFYGELEINKQMMGEMLRNFAANTYGQKIYVNVAHNDSHGAAGEIVRIFEEGNRLRGEIEWTEMGLDAIHNRGFRYFSVEFVEDYQDPETETRHGATLLGAAITIRPRVKRLDPIDPEKLTLSEDTEDSRIIVLPNVRKMLSEEITMLWEKLRKLLEEKLTGLGLGADQVKKLSESFVGSVTGVTDETVATKLQESFLAAGTQLHEQLKKNPNAQVNLTVQMPEGKLLTEDQVKQMIAQSKADEANQAKKLAEDLGTRVKLFNDTLDAAEGLKVLGEKKLSEIKAAGAELLTPTMTDEQVKKLTEHYIKLGNELAVATQLAARGFQQPGATGVVHITMDESNAIKELQETVDKRIFSDVPNDKRYTLSEGKPIESNRQFVEKELARFDRDNAQRLHSEATNMKRLSAGDSLVSDVAVPAIYERTVLREALFQLTGLGLCDVGSVNFTAVAQIPYSYRDTTAAGVSATRKYEGQAISRAAVKQAIEEARPLPQKLAFEVSDELRYLIGNGQINYDIVAENTLNAARIIGEDTEQLIYNEHLRASDEFATANISNENLELQADDAKKVFILAQWPVVRPRKVYDLQGSQVGSTLYPITVTYNSVARSEYDGTGTQASGIYYVMNYNLGEIYLVDETGAIQIPANGTAYTISYSYTTNVKKWDMDLGSLTVAQKYNDFLYEFGVRKTVLEDRSYMANLGIMSGTLRDMIGRAEQFSANFKRNGTDLDSEGNVGRIKDVPTWRSFAPGLYAGDQRVLVAQRRTTRFRMMKPWVMNQLENQKNSDGRFTGKKEAYGDQFIVVHTPTQLKAGLTSIVVYSATARVARAAP